MRRSVYIFGALAAAYAAACSCGTTTITVRDSNGHSCQFVPHSDAGLTCSPGTPDVDGGCKPDEQPCWQLAILGPQAPGPQTWIENLCPACCSATGASLDPAACSPLICSDTEQCITYGVICAAPSCSKSVTCNDGGGCL
jgi:hypothetical protein